jgi:UDP-N-acetylglucosamine 1-carboxyvinyltransferase
LILDVFGRLGVQAVWCDGVLRIDGTGARVVEPLVDGSIPVVADAPWPGFPADLLGPALAAAVNARGDVLFHQKMFDSRLFFVPQLQAAGARLVLCDPHRALVIGLGSGRRLQGGRMSAPDIRSGMALLATALGADGVTVLDGAEQLDRGYAQLEVRLRGLGAEIERG